MQGPPEEQDRDQHPDSFDPTAGSGDVGIARDFRQAWVDRQTAPSARPELLPDRLARACADVLDIDGAGLSFFYDDFRVPVGASDEIATVAERLQFTQGEGPCLEAAASHRMLMADADQLENRWPTFAGELFKLTPFRSIVSLPLALTPRTYAALDLYLKDTGAAERFTFADVYAVSQQIVTALATAIHQTLAEDERAEAEGSDADLSEDYVPVWLTTPTAQARTHVWVAMGMAMTKFDLSAADAMALLRSYAYGHERLVDDVAAELVEGRITLGELQR